jgi:chromosome segregation ATPase
VDSSTALPLLVQAHHDEEEEEGQDNNNNGDEEEEAYQQAKLARETRIRDMEVKLLQAESELSKLREDAYEGEAALLEAQNDLLLNQQKFDKVKMEKDQTLSARRHLSENITRLEMELRRKVEQAQSLEVELAQGKRDADAFQTSRRRSRDKSLVSVGFNNNNINSGSTDPSSTIRAELKQIVQNMSDHQRAIEGLERKGEEAAQLVLRYRNRVVGLQQEVEGAFFFLFF